MRKRVIVTYKMPIEGYTELIKKCDVLFPKEIRFTKEDVLNQINQFDALLSDFTFQVDREILDKGVNLQIVSNGGVGYDNIDVNYCTQKRILVTNTPQPVIQPTADLALGLMLSVARNIVLCDRKLRDPKGYQWGLLKNIGVSLYGKTLGIIGLGRIGKALAVRALACGMKIVYYNRHPLDKAEEKIYHATYLPFETLLVSSDFISLNAPYTPETYHIINKQALSLMKKTAILINTARGQLIHEEALVNALKEHRIWGAGLDVFEFGEKIHPDLLKLDNVVLNPHIGTQTTEARNEITQVASQNIIHFFENKDPIFKVNKL